MHKKQRQWLLVGTIRINFIPQFRLTDSGIGIVFCVQYACYATGALLSGFVSSFGVSNSSQKYCHQIRCEWNSAWRNIEQKPRCDCHKWCAIEENGVLSHHHGVGIPSQQMAECAIPRDRSANSPSLPTQSIQERFCVV